MDIFALVIFLHFISVCGVCRRCTRISHFIFLKQGDDSMILLEFICFHAPSWDSAFEPSTSSFPKNRDAASYKSRVLKETRKLYYSSREMVSVFT